MSSSENAAPTDIEAQESQVTALEKENAEMKGFLKWLDEQDSTAASATGSRTADDTGPADPQGDSSADASTNGTKGG